MVHFGSLLLATSNVSQRDPAIEAILLNDEAIAINQDPWAMPTFRINASASKRRRSRSTTRAATTPSAGSIVTTVATSPSSAPAPAAPTEQWGRLLAGGDVAALILNRHSNNGDPGISARLDFADLIVAAGRRTAATTAAAAGKNVLYFPRARYPGEERPRRGVRGQGALGSGCGHTRRHLFDSRLPVPASRDREGNVDMAAWTADGHTTLWAPTPARAEMWKGPFSKSPQFL